MKVEKCNNVKIEWMKERKRKKRNKKVKREDKGRKVPIKTEI